jgi:ABC-type glutathione transport system ATPase component
VIDDAKLPCEETALAVRKGHVLGLIVESDSGKTTISVMTRGSIVSYSSNSHVLTPPFDDYTVIEVEDWNANHIATVRHQSITLSR